MAEENISDIELEAPTTANGADLLELRIKIAAIEIGEDLLRKLDDQINKEKMQLKRDWGFVAKVLAISIAVVATALGILGWQGWKDVRAGIDDAANRRLDEYLKASPPTKFEKDVERLYDEAVVRNYLAEIPRGPREAVRFPALVNRDLATLLKILSAPQTEEQECNQILQILSHIPDLPTPDYLPAVRTLVTTGSRPNWLENSPRRWAYLITALTLFKDRDVSSRIRELLTRNSAPREVQLAALEYIRKLSVTDATPEVEGILISPYVSEEVEITTLYTLAIIAPASPKLAEHLLRIENKPSRSQRDILAYIAVVAGLNTRTDRSYYLPREDEDQRQALATAMFRNVLRQHYDLMYYNTEVRLVFNTAAIEPHAVPLDILLSTGLSHAAEGVLKEKGRDFQAIDELIRHFSVAEDGERWQYLPYFYYFAGTLGLKDGTSLSYADTAGKGVWMSSKGGDVVLYWVSQAGKPRSEVLQTIDNFTPMHFEISRTPDWLFNWRNEH